jgi:hypothetical protein
MEEIHHDTLPPYRQYPPIEADEAGQQMNIPSPSAKLNEKLESARTKLATIPSLADEAMKEIERWLGANDRMDSFDAEVAHVHAHRIRTHSAGLAELIAGLGAPLPGRVLLLSGATRILVDGI